MTKQPRLLVAQAPPKCPTGIRGFDQITNGGPPRNRSSLVCGGAGAGKTMFGVEFLARGARDFGEPGVFVSFEEHAASSTRSRRGACASSYRGTTHGTNEYPFLIDRTGFLVPTATSCRSRLPTAARASRRTSCRNCSIRHHQAAR